MNCSPLRLLTPRTLSTLPTPFHAPRPARAAIALPTMIEPALKTAKNAKATWLTAVLMTASPIAAAQSSYAIIGAGCVPTGQTSSAAVHFNSAGDTSFSSAKVGEIILTCPVPQTLLVASRLDVIYRDTDGRTGAARVLATLRQKDLITAAASNVGIASVDSNQHDAVAVTTYARMGANIASGGCGDFTFDHARMAYYVQINITRLKLTEQAIFASVMLSTPVC